MKKEDTVTAKAASGASYSFDVYPWGTSFKALGAVYLVLKKSLDGNYTILYVGQTGNLSERFDDHHKNTCFSRNGRTHIGIKPESVETTRLAIETDLVRNYNPTCNG